MSRHPLFAFNIGLNNYFFNPKAWFIDDILSDIHRCTHYVGSSVPPARKHTQISIGSISISGMNVSMRLNRTSARTART
ncbi:unnamed protein product, partial [Nesidiocoris tenuis]